MADVQVTNQTVVLKEKVVEINPYLGEPRYIVAQKIAGLSTDLKPTNVGMGSIFIETDTGDKYVYDAFDEEWTLLGSGGGGGGDSDFSTATATISIPRNLIDAEIVVCLVYDTPNFGAILTDVIGASGETHIVQVPLYKNMCIMSGKNLEDYNVATSGDVSYEDGQFIITGDCTISLTES